MYAIKCSECDYGIGFSAVTQAEYNRAMDDATERIIRHRKQAHGDAKPVTYLALDDGE